MSLKNVLIVEDEIIIALDIQGILERLNYHVIDICSNYDDALAIINLHPVDLVLLDIHLEKSKSGIEIANYIKQNHHIPFVFLTAFNDEKTFGEALKTAPFGYINKPFSLESIRNAIAIAFNIFETKSVPELKAIVSLIETFPNPVILLNSLDNVEAYSKSMAALLEIGPNEIKNKNIESIFKEIGEDKIEIIKQSGEKIYNEYAFEKIPFFIEEKFFTVLLIKTKDKIENVVNKQLSEDIFIKNKSELVKININSILYVEAMDNYSKIITLEKTYIANGYLSEIEKKLNSSKFFRTHRSYIINIDKIEKIVETGVIINQKTIPISKSFKPLLMSIIDIF